MRSTAVVVVALSLFCSCLLPSGTRAFIPAGSPLANSARGEAPRRTAASGVAAAPVVASRPARSSGAMRMVDQDVLMAGGVALAGVICGAGLVAFTEAQGERTAQRGSISDTTKQKMSAQFMEDDEMPSNYDVDDVRSRMRAALRADQTAEELAQMTAKATAREVEEADDGW